MKEAKVPGLAALTLKEGKIFWAGYYGWANIETKTPVTQDTLFQLASISKTVTACMIMQQVEQGKLKLDVDINTLLPFKVRNPRHVDTPITLRQLLTHTSGIRDNWSVLENTWVKNGDFKKPLAESLPAYLVEGGEFFSAKKSFYGWAPGTKDQYCNVAVALAAYVAEAKLKTPFEALCQQGLLSRWVWRVRVSCWPRWIPRKWPCLMRTVRKRMASRHWVIMGISISQPAPCARQCRIWRGFS